MLGETRELALRAQLHLEAELEGMRQLASALAYHYGVHDGVDKVVVELSDEQIAGAKEWTEAVAFVPSGDNFAIVVTLLNADEVERRKAERDRPFFYEFVVERPAGATREQVLAAATKNVHECVDALFDDEDGDGAPE